MLEINFVTDYVCPFCMVTKEALEQAILDLHIRKDVKITFWPYELTKPGDPQADPIHDDAMIKHYQKLAVPAEDLMMGSMQLPPHVSPRPYTRLAHEAWLYACDHDRGNLWAASMYHAYFMEEIDIGSREELKHIARTMLLDPEDLEKAWDEGRYTQKLLDLEKEAQEKFQPRSVPCVYIDGKYAKLKEFTKEEVVLRIQEALLHATVPAPAEPKANRAFNFDDVEDDVVDTGMSCGIDGCK